MYLESFGGSGLSLRGRGSGLFPIQMWDTFRTISAISTSCRRVVGIRIFANVTTCGLIPCFPELANDPRPNCRALLHILIKVDVHTLSPSYLVDSLPVFYPPCVLPPYPQSQPSDYRNEARSVLFLQECDLCRRGRHRIQPGLLVRLDTVGNGVIHATPLHSFCGIRRMGEHNAFVCTTIRGSRIHQMMPSTKVLPCTWISG